MSVNLYEEMCADFFPVFKKILDCEKYAITLGGSHGKGVSDVNSDYDFRIFYEKSVSKDEMKLIGNEVKQLVAKWDKKGVKVDGIWPRSVEEIDRQIDSVFSGNFELVHKEWTLWGYSVLTDVFNQKIVEDPFGIAQNWKNRLSVYPDALKNSILAKACSSLRYWRNDYHYLSKLKRKDVTFLASIASRLINDIIQIIYALNEFYYPGDGMNLTYTVQFKVKPQNFEDRVTGILYPSPSGDIFQTQYDELIRLIDDTLGLV